VLTTAADENGNWTYDLSNSLADGEHTVYVTVTDDTGKVATKSNPLSFVVQAAQAITPQDFLNQQVTAIAASPIETKQTWYLWGVAVLIAMGAAAAYVVMRRMRKVGNM
jgi:hypothetical protein